MPSFTEYKLSASRSQGLFRSALVMLLFLAQGTPFAQSVSTVISSNLFEPYGIAVDEINLYWVADSANNRILRYDPTTGASTNIAGLKGPQGLGGVDGLGEAARFFNPQGIVAIPSSVSVRSPEFNICDFRDLEFFELSLRFQGDTYSKHLYSLLSSDTKSLLQSDDHALKQQRHDALIADLNRLIRGPSLSAPVFENVLSGETRALRDTNPTGAELVRLNRMILDDAFDSYINRAPRLFGGVIVSDSGNHLIRHISNNGEVTTLAGDLASAGAGQPAAGNVNGPGCQARFRFPAGMALDLQKNILIADVLNGSIRRLYLPSLVVSNVTGSVFRRPTAVTMDANGNIYVADAETHTIYWFKEGDATQLAPRVLAGSNSRFSSGFRNGLNGNNALFDSPRGLLWAPGTIELLVADSGNHVIRRISRLKGASGSNTSPRAEEVLVETYPPTDTAGLANPIGLARDVTGGILIVDQDKGQVRRVSSSQQVQPPAPNPQIGILMTNFACYTLLPVTNSTFNNEVVVIMRKINGVSTYFTYGNSENAENIPDPTLRDNEPPFFEDCMNNFPDNILNRITRTPKITIKAINTQEDRRPSEVVTATFIFQTANPSILVSSGGGIKFQTITEGAKIYYTVGTSEATTPDPTPTNNPPALLFDPNQGQISVPRNQNSFLKVRAYRSPDYLPSAIVTRAFLTNDVSPVINTIGVPRDFKAGVGAKLVIPVQVLLAENEIMQSLQYRFEVAPTNSDVKAPIVTFLPTNGFFNINYASAIPASSATYDAGGTTNGIYVAYLGTNATFNVVGSATVGLIQVNIPPTAKVGDVYRVRIKEASATSDGVASAIAMTPNFDRYIMVTNISYLVGDTATATWYHSGDFGDGILGNNDVNNVFLASLGVRVPFAFTDAFDAMDAFPFDTATTVGGDGQIRLLDWQTILDRSLALPTATSNVYRSWNAAGERAMISSGQAPAPNTPATVLSATSTAIWHRQARLQADVIEQAQPGAVVEIPIRLKVEAGAQVRALSLRVNVAPQGHAPHWSQSLQFITGEGVGNPVQSGGDPATGLLCGWPLGSFATALTGDVLLGKLRFTVPAASQKGQSYSVRFLAVDAAADNHTQLDAESIPGAVWVQSASQTAIDPIAVEWTSHFLGHLPASQNGATADPDSDGHSNLAEYQAGTHPADAHSHLQLLTPTLENGNLVLRWQSAPGKVYQIQTAASLTGSWSSLSGSVTGDGGAKTFTVPKSATSQHFYRLTIIP